MAHQTAMDMLDCETRAVSPRAMMLHRVKASHTVVPVRS